MREIWIVAKRTMKLYLKNPLAILFSLVYMLLFVVLFSTFLGEYLSNGMKEAYAEVQGMDFDKMRWLVDATAMAGVLMINCILVPLNVLSIMVQDNADKKLDSFLVSAASRDKLVLGYWLAPFLVGIFMNAICLFIAQGFIVLNGGHWLDMVHTMQMLGLIVVNTFSSVSILFAAAMLVKTPTVFNTITGIVSALAGFVTGAFLPIGVLPQEMQNLFVLLPPHHGATMMREIMAADSLSAVFGGVPDQMVKGTFMTAGEILEIYRVENGISYLLGGGSVAFSLMLAVVTLSGLIFLLFSMQRMKHYQNR